MKIPLLLAALLVGAAAPAAEPTKLRAYVPVPPYEYLLQRLGGDWVEVRAIVGEGGDPHSYSPSPRQVADIARSNLLFAGGLSFEGNFYVAVGDGKSGPKEIDLLEGLDLMVGSCSECAAAHGEEKEADNDPAGDSPAKAPPGKAARTEGDVDSAHKHDHGEDEDGHKHDHDHEETDAHVWLSPKVLRLQAERVAAVFKAELPAAAAADVDANLAALLADLDAVDAELKAQLGPMKGRTFYVYHGAFAYFARDYGLVQKAIEVGNRKPSPKQVAAIARQAQEEKVSTIFVQPQFDRSSAEALAESIGGKVEALDPLERDVLGNLRAIGRALGSPR